MKNAHSIEREEEPHKFSERSTLVKLAKFSAVATFFENLGLGVKLPQKRSTGLEPDCADKEWGEMLRSGEGPIDTPGRTVLLAEVTHMVLRCLHPPTTTV